MAQKFLQKFKLVLRAKGREISENDVDFALILIDEYVKYPMDNWKNAKKSYFVADPINCTSDSLCHWMIYLPFG